MASLGQALLASIPILLSLYSDKNREENRNVEFPGTPTYSDLPQEKIYDFIVVGAGTGGCIVARRLVDAGHKVLLLEAGGDPPPVTTIPALWFPTIWQSNFLPGKFSFNHLSVPQKHASLAYPIPGVFPIIAGKMMGGSSGIHTMIYNRGNPPDYNNWAEITGDLSWRYENVLQYWLKAERYRGEFPSNEQHNPDGLLTVTKQSFTPGMDSWKKAGEELGYSFGDPNGPQISGFSPVEVTVKENGTRESTYTAYVQPIEKIQTRLTIERYAVVSQVIIEQVGGKKVATGVQYTHHLVRRLAKATKGVILCAGAYISPLILINSGVGPEGPLVKLPVGENLHDHSSIPIPFEAPIPYSLENNLTQQDIDNYYQNGKGPLSSSKFSSQCFVDSGRDKPPNIPLTEKEKAKTSNNFDHGLWPDLTIFLGNSFGYNPFDHAPNRLQCLILLGRPRSRGTVKLNTTAIPLGFDHSTIPIVDYQLYTEPTDIKVALAGVRMCEKIVKSNAFKKMGARWITSKKSELIKPCAEHEVNSDSYWICYIEQVAGAVYHTAGTVKMGKLGDAESCLDSRLRVIGIDNLRVADASIMPQVPNGNTQAPVIMIAEKAAAMIIEDTSSEHGKMATGGQRTQS